MRKLIPGIAAFLLTAAVIIPGGKAVAGDEKITTFMPETAEPAPTTATLPSLVVSATGYEIPQNKATGDITVITSEEISHLPVHSMDEALNYLMGLDFQRGGGPGTPSMLSLQGSDPIRPQIKILIDDIPFEFMSGSPVDLAAIPLENVERVEIVKGAASSSWGSTMGGVINIITKRPTEKSQAEGGISIGEHETHRYNAGISGRTNDVGYVLTVSRFETDGFFDNQNAMTTNFYGKLTRQISTEIKAEASYGYSKIDRRYPLSSTIYIDEDTYDHHGRVLLSYAPRKELEFSLSIYDRQFNTDYLESSPWFFPPENGNGIGRDRENLYGAGIKSVWRHSENATFSAGGEASHGDLLYLGGWNGDQDRGRDKKTFFANEALELGDINLNMGVRYDDDSIFGSEASPSAGVVYKLAQDTLFRLNAARGFSTPAITDPFAGSGNPDLTAERAWSYQAGAESGAVPGLWVKATFYRTDITDAIIAVDDGSGGFFMDNINKLRRQGVDAEVKTREHKGLSLSYGYAFNDVRDLETDTIVKGQARVVHNAGVDYRGPFDTRTTLNGHYIYWHADPTYNAKDRNFLWDARVSKYFARWKYAIGEVFVSVHNITDVKQYWIDTYPNPGRWVEVGVNLTSF